MNESRIVRDSATPALEQALGRIRRCRAPDALGGLQALEVVRVEERKGKAAVRMTVDGEVLFVKIYWSLSARQKLRDVVRRIPLGVREARNFARLRSIGIDTPELIAYGSTSNWSVPVHSYLLMKELPQAETLWEYVRSTGDTAAASAAGGLLWRIHNGGLLHRDLHAKNLLLSRGEGPGRLYVIDTLGVGPGTGGSERIVELVRFLRKHGRCWLDDDAVESFCRNYYEPGGDPVRAHPDYEGFRRAVDRELSKYRPYSAPR